MESGAHVRESLALAYWPRVAGAQAAAATEAVCVRDGVLFVRTRSSTWSHELTFYKTHLLLRLNRMLGGKIIRDIIFQAQGLTRPAPPPEEETPTDEALAAVVLDAAEKAELRGLLQDLTAIEEDEVRHTIAKRLIHEARLRHWRLEHGWRVCPRCTVLHKTEHRLCPICRLCS